MIVPPDVFVPYTPAHAAALEQKYPHAYTQRIQYALEVSLDLETCAALLRGEPVDPSRLDRQALERLKQRRLVQLVAPVDLLLPDAAAA